MLRRSAWRVHIVFLEGLLLRFCYASSRERKEISSLLPDKGCCPHLRLSERRSDRGLKLASAIEKAASTEARGGEAGELACCQRESPQDWTCLRRKRDRQSTD